MNPIIPDKFTINILVKMKLTSKSKQNMHVIQRQYCKIQSKTVIKREEYTEKKMLSEDNIARFRAKQ